MTLNVAPKCFVSGSQTQHMLFCWHGRRKVFKNKVGCFTEKNNGRGRTVTRNPAYRRHWISWSMPIEAPIPFLFFFILFGGQHFFLRSKTIFFGEGPNFFFLGGEGGSNVFPFLLFFLFGWYFFWGEGPEGPEGQWEALKEIPDGAEPWTDGRTWRLYNWICQVGPIQWKYISRHLKHYLFFHFFKYIKYIKHIYVCRYTIRVQGLVQDRGYWQTI